MLIPHSVCPLQEMFETKLPQEASWVSDVQIHRDRFDPSRACAGLAIDNNGYSVEQTNSTNTHKCIYTQTGVSSGRHYWAFKVLNAGPTNYVMVGIANNARLDQSFFPGYSDDKGVSYYGHNGHRYFAGTNAAYGPTFTTGDEIGVLANLDFKTVSFFKNGKLVGCALGSDHMLDNTVYYPVIALYQLGSKVVSMNVAD